MKSIKLKVFHQEENKKQLECIYQGVALLEKSKTLLYQDDQSATKVFWDSDKKQMMVFRQAEMQTLLLLNQNDLGTITITNEYGEIQLKNETQSIEISEDQWIVDYEVINGSERMKHRFIWMIEENRNERS